VITPGYRRRFGGVERHVEEIVRRTALNDYEVTVFAQDAQGVCAESQDLDGVHVLRFPTIGVTAELRVSPQLMAAFARRSREFDIVHYHGYHATPALAGALFPCRYRVFTPHYHGEGHTRVRRMLHVPYRPLGAMEFKRADAVVCVSEAEARLVGDHFPGTAGRIVVIPNGSSLPAAHVAPFDVEHPVVLSVGRIERYKRIDLLVEAVARQTAPVMLVIVGEGPDRARLEATAARLGRAERICFTGRVSDLDLSRWMRTATIVASLSEHEAYGIALGDGIAAGARALGSKIPAYEELRDRAGANVVRLVSPLAGGEVVVVALREEIARGRPEAGERRLESWAEVGDQIVSVYERLAALRRSSPNGNSRRSRGGRGA
jgi:glycosyltransferase involved in cell wall biosynthesis